MADSRVPHPTEESPQAAFSGTSPAHSRLFRAASSDAVTGGLAVLIIALAFVVRFLYSREGLPYLHFCDEPWLAVHALQMLTTGDYSPHWFHWGSLMMYLDLLVDIPHYFYLMTQPPTASIFLNHISDITFDPTFTFPWLISHPSFYLWNRWITVLMGGASVAIVYYVTSLLSGRWTGILAAALLAGIPFHIELSSIATTDVPASFFTLLALLLSTLYLHRRKSIYLLLALAACGFAASTKYNAIVCIACPLIALAAAAIRRSAAHRWWLWLCLPAVPLLACVVGTPYSVLDLPSFLEGAGYSVRHYKILGHTSFTVEPGIPHVILQLRMMFDNITPIPAIVAALGIVAIAIRRRVLSLMILGLAASGFWLVAGTIVSFHRNVVGMYPLAAIAFGCGAIEVYRLIARLRPRRPKLATALHALLSAVLAASLVYLDGATLAAAWSAWSTPETRTQAVRQLDGLVTASESPQPVLGIASELRVHDDDLRPLTVPHIVLPTSVLVCHSGALQAIALGANHAAYYPEGTYKAERLNNLVNGLSALDPPVAIIGDSSPLYLDLFSVDPGVLLFALPAHDVPTPELCREPGYSMNHVIERDFALLTSEPRTLTLGFALRPGDCNIYCNATGTPALDEYPILAAAAGTAIPTEPHTLASGTFELTRYPEEYELPFTLTEPASIEIELRLTNDLFVADRQEDRNAAFSVLGVKSVADAR